MNSQKVTEKIALCHTSDVLFLIIQNGYGRVAVNHKALQPLPDCVVFMKKYC